MTLFRLENDLVASVALDWTAGLRFESCCLALGTEDRLVLVLPMVEYAYGP
jgi:hypothetical protein